MRYQRQCGSRYSRGGGIDWGRTIVFCAILTLIFSALHWLIGGVGIIIACLVVVGWYFSPSIIRNIQIKHRDKAARKRDPVSRTELLDWDD